MLKARINETDLLFTIVVLSGILKAKNLLNISALFLSGCFCFLNAPNNFLKKDRKFYHKHFATNILVQKLLSYVMFLFHLFPIQKSIVQ
jgi:hypothetical protein